MLVNHRWLCCDKSRSQHWENPRLDCSKFRHMPRLPVDYFILLWFRFIQKGLFKILFKTKVKSLMIKCINHGFWSNGHCKCSQPHCTLSVYAGLLCCDPCVLLEQGTVTHFIKSKSQQYIWIQFERELNDEYSGIWNEQFYWHFPSKLCGRKRAKIYDVISLVLLQVSSYFKRRVKEKSLLW